MRPALGPRGLRARIVLAFAAGALLVSAVLVGTTFVLARGYLLDQREDAATRAAFVDADLLRNRLATSGTEIADVLAQLPSGASEIVVRSGGSWYSSSLDVGARDVPPELQELVAGGSVGRVRSASSDGPRLVVGVPVAGADLEFYELAPLVELQSVLRTLGIVLGAGALTATAAGAAFGVWASRRVVQPLDQVAAAATRIAGGEVSTRLPPTDDPDLAAIVGSFNTMVDALAARIERDARFVGDVSHELRSPLTGLVTSVEVLAGRGDELSPRSREALRLVEQQLAAFRATLDDLLELARLDDDTAPHARTPIVLAQLVREVLSATGRRADLVVAHQDETTAIAGDKRELERAVRNLLDNADRHGGGACCVHVQRREDTVVLSVDDAGPGVFPEDRERIFERFVRGPRAARGSLPGAGLGLAIVAEAAARHGGSAWCSASPCGGARMNVSIPAVDA
ncbi:MULTISPECIES: sensor histidine kinase [unclassified Blastococcus]